MAEKTPNAHGVCSADTWEFGESHPWYLTFRYPINTAANGYSFLESITSQDNKS